MKKNDILEVNIIAQGCEGEGVAKPGGFPLFVSGAIRGEVCRVQVVKLAKSHGFARLLEVLSPADSRVLPPCPVYEKCGGCSLMHMDRDAQLTWKRSRVEEAFTHIGGLSAIVAPTEGDDRIAGYRNKIQMPVALTKDGVAAGFFAPRSHRIVPFSGCLLQSPKTQKIIDAVILWMQEYAVMPYDEESHRGVVRHIFIREGDGEDCMVSLVTRTRTLPFAEALAERMRSCGVSTLLQNINSARTNVILGEETRVLYGSGRITKTLGGLTFSVSHHSFFQVNAPMAERLYEKGLSLLGDISDKTVFDLYSGIGSISLFLARQAKKVIGVEIVPAAVEDAKKNAEANGLANAHFFAGDAYEVTDKLIKEGEKADACVVDPPRKGCSPELLETLLHMHPEKILYISCNPATLARDVKILSENGYSCGTVYPFDLFPNTSHVETVVLLQRQNT
ncbi:MAG: 23S rRNA (uracil(1939)-C(5))-methyltransferase RlmD [Ruminococcaceae bacterium]|nr:23S rRNA (uracil(1939)-C(5))-methyltransferase RlmD [Oscillospiraceae bacterium]